MADDDKDAVKGTATRWLDDIEKARKDLGEYYQVCAKIRDLYRDEKSADSKRGFNVLWSNIQTIGPVVYSQVPKPVVVSRFNDGDAIPRMAGLSVERTIRYMLEECNYQNVLLQARDDFLLYARGVARLRYEPVMVQAQLTPQLDDVDGLGPDKSKQVETDDAPPADVLDFETVKLDFVNLRDFTYPKSRIWAEIPWVSFRSFLSRDELVDRFGDEIGNAIPTQADLDRKSDNDGIPNQVSGDKATIYEVWDKENQKVIWLAEGYKDILEEGEPYLKFEGFFPCPEPCSGTLTTDTYIPRPDYIFYQNQVEEIYQLTERINKLTDQLKVVGFYGAGPDGEGIPQIEKALQPNFENKMIAVPDMSKYMSGAGGGLPIVFLPVEQVIKVIQESIALRKELIQDIYQITGISDIIRGQTNPNETAEAQNMKQQWGMSRMDDRRRSFARFCRDIVRMCGEIICSQFQVSTILKIANIKLPARADIDIQKQQAQLQWQQAAHQATLNGQPPPPPPETSALDSTPTVEDIEELIRDKALITFRLDIETDSTVLSNAQQERADRTAFIQAITQFIEGWGPIVQQRPELGPLAGELMKFGVKGFPVARELEEVIDKTVMDMEAKLAQPQPPPPNPEMEKAKADIQISQSKAQSDIQVNTQKAQNDMELDQRKMALEEQQHQLEQSRAEREHQLEQVRAENEHKQKLAHIANEHALKLQAAEAERKAKLKKHETDLALQREKSAADLSVADKKKEGDSSMGNQMAAALKELGAHLAKYSEDQAQKLAAALNKPKRLIFDPKTGRPVGAETMQ
jgi:hypothetical protein